MAVTTPGLLWPDGLSVTISQVPGVSLPQGDNMGGRRGGPAAMGGVQLPLFAPSLLCSQPHAPGATATDT